MSQNQAPGDGRSPQPGQSSPSPAPQPYGQSGSQPYSYPSAPQPYTYQSPQPSAQPYAYPSQQPQSQGYTYPSQQPPAQPYQQSSNQPAGYPVQPYAQTGGVAAGYTTPRAEKRSPVLGALALVLVVVCGIVLSWMMWRLGGLVGPLVVNGSVDVSNQPEVQQALISQLGGMWAVLLEGSVALGFAGWIMGIVAAATKRGTGLGVTAIVLGALAPFAAIGVLVAALAPYVSS